MKPIEIRNTIYRRTNTTFTKNQIINLQKYGDLICIDPTCSDLRSIWSVIALTVIGSSCEMLSAGGIFCSNVTNDSYQWFIKLLAINFHSAFSKMEYDPIIRRINRIICCWHK